MLNVQKILNSSLAMIAVLAMATSVSAQDQTRFVLKLDNDLISSFRSYGSLRSEVPDKFKEKISFVELQFSDTKDAEPIELDLGIQINGDNANIILNDDVIDKVKGQPVRVSVSPENNSFKQIVLMYDAPVSTAAPQLNDSGQPVDMVYMRLTNSRTLGGSIDGFDQFEIETRFGKVSMPMDQVAGIKFHTDSKDSAVVILSNGDSVTGIPTIPAIKLKTDWGQADIEPQFIDSMTTTTNARFRQDNSDFGSRWKLSTGNSIAPSAPTFRNN